VRIATFATPLSRDGPGLLLRDIIAGDDPQIRATIDIIDQIAPDILLLTDIDFDSGGIAVRALSDALQFPFPHRFTHLPNAGQQTGLDLDGNGVAGDAQDALGYGRFLGDGGMAILSRYEIDGVRFMDFSSVLWRDLPNAVLPKVGGLLFPTADVFESLPVSSTGHWMVPIIIGDTPVTLLAFDATPPVFDGPEDFNGLRNRDELRLWEAVLNGELGPVPAHPVVIGNANIDPVDGEGLRAGIAEFLTHPALQDAEPRSDGGAFAGDPDHLGTPALDTVDWPDGRPGNLRVSYILPSRDLKIAGAGVFWPAPSDPLSSLMSDEIAHRLVWIDLAVHQ